MSLQVDYSIQTTEFWSCACNFGEALTPETNLIHVHYHSFGHSVCLHTLVLVHTVPARQLDQRMGYALAAGFLGLDVKLDQEQVDGYTAKKCTLTSGNFVLGTSIRLLAIQLPAGRFGFALPSVQTTDPRLMLFISPQQIRFYRQRHGQRRPACRIAQ